MKKQLLLVLACGWAGISFVRADAANRVIVQPKDATMGGYYTISINGGDAVSGKTYITNEVPVGSSITVTLIPNKSRQFLYWCRGVNPDQARQASFTFTPTAERILIPLVRSSVAEPCTRTWINANPSSDKKDRPWYTDSHWSPSGVPGPDDDVVFNTPVATYGYDFIAVKSLTVGAAAKIRIGVSNGGTSKYVDTDVESEYFTPYTTGGHGDIAIDASGDVILTNGCQLAVGCINNTEFTTSLKVGGDLMVGTGAKLCVFAGETNAVRSLASGAGFIAVGGKLTVDTDGVIKPYSEPYTGGSVVISAESVEIAGSGSVNADLCGYKCFADKEPTTGCPGDFGSYGGTTYNGETTYGFLASPVHPGSGNKYSESSNLVRGGGLIRIHSRGDFSFSGTLRATSSNSSGFAGSGSGGGIWVTAKSFTFGGGAAVDVSCGYVTTATYSAGGRVAFAEVTDETALTSFAASGVASGYSVRKLEKFRQKYGETLSVNLSHGTSRSYTEDRVKCNGTFAWVEPSTGLMLLLR